ncbi:lysophospholipid acyltransferase family protein [Dongia soli]|uniref:Lysophospholipid acyltransferase family protein n=1 Tax=Dongia soli TaxID=600628 RepID=A0ABU5EGU2_9PROT|nr:lysophospholipid acyltransferase family protein [Dongia soli]MDY0885557.1 lysophospholipid acyltransferase family protein [Dongia soli]
MSNLAALEMEPIELSYASQCDGLVARGFIHLTEILTGQIKLKRLYELYRSEMRGRMDFWVAAMRLLNISIRYDAAKLAAVPRNGPLVIVANHPFGLVDGLLIGNLTNHIRSDFKVLTNARLYPPDADVQQYILPIDFDPTEAARQTNLATRAAARAHLKAGGCLIVFPAGGVATTPTPFARRAIDLDWKPFTARLIHEAKASVLPIYFHGQNSRLFQIASHISMTARLALLLHEVANKMGRQFRATIGDVFAYEQVQPIRDSRALCRFLRDRTHSLAD